MKVGEELRRSLRIWGTIVFVAAVLIATTAVAYWLATMARWA